MMIVNGAKAKQSPEEVQVQDVHDLINELENDLDRIRRLHSTIIESSTDVDTNHEAKEELEQQLVSTIKNASCAIRGSLLDIEQAVAVSDNKGKEREDHTKRNSRILAARVKRGESQFNVDEVERLVQDGNVGVLTQGISEECEELRRIFGEMGKNPKGVNISNIDKSMAVLNRHQMLIDRANATLAIGQSSSSSSSRSQGHQKHDPLQQSQQHLVQGNENSIERMNKRISESRISMYKSREMVYQSQVFKSKKYHDSRTRKDRIKLCSQITCIIFVSVAAMFLVIVFLGWTVSEESSAGPLETSSNHSLSFED